MYVYSLHLRVMNKALMLGNNLIHVMGWFMFHQKMFNSFTLASLQVTLFGNRIFADGEDEIIKVGPNDWYSYKRGSFQ